MPRRSPRNHNAAATPTLSVNVKAAQVDWTGETCGPCLEAHLISALECNKRWRCGLFTSSENHTSVKSAKDCYYHEIARALFFHHPLYNASFQSKPRAFARAVKDRVDELPSTLAAAVLSGTKHTRTSAAKVSSQFSLQRLQDQRTWARHRKQLKSSNIESTLWHPALPLELQHRVIEALLSSETDSPVDYHTAAIISTVSRSWYSEVVRYLYSTVIVSQHTHYYGLFSLHGPAHYGPMHIDGPGKWTRVLRLLTPPKTDFRLCLHRTPIERVEFDFGSSKIFFDNLDPDTSRPLRELGRNSSRISCLATASIPLYQLTLSLNATTLRLFISPENPISKDDIWQDLLAGHVAALRMMTSLEHLILDAELYLVLLPGYFQTWCDNEQWQGFLDALKAEEGVIKMATFFDETPLTTLTFVGTHVPTLAFLSRISRAPKVKQINLAGWKKEGIPKSWMDYVETDQKEGDPLSNWVDDVNSI